ncbi:MAG TPA: response regulator [Candidatus Saccharimonas sp.]|jgi:DNA-binding response OmpR family regulator|nr:response regulator [Candidatus Saccharimonas sp.]
MPIQSILVIEDDRFIGEMYVRSLQHAGYTVDWVVDGSDGLVTATGKKYDCILLDIMLPEKRGTDILRELRGSGVDKIPGTRIIVLTNFDQDTESRMAMQHDVDAYLIKAEITPRRLLEVIAKLDAPAQPTA